VHDESQRAVGSGAATGGSSVAREGSASAASRGTAKVSTDQQGRKLSRSSRIAASVFAIALLVAAVLALVGVLEAAAAALAVAVISGLIAAYGLWRGP
jgi:hypothetical protein